MRVLKYLRGHIPAVALIVLLLVAQSFCELSLPAYTSRIVDTGIQSGGIEYAAPLALTDKTMDGVRLFLSDDDAAAVSAAYTDADGVWTINDTAQLPELEGIFIRPLVMYARLSEQGANTVLALRQQMQGGLITHEEILARGEEALSGMGTLTDSVLHSAAVQFLKTEYAVAGLNVNHIRNSYLLRTGGKMLLLTLGMIAAAVLCNFVGARMSAAIGRDLRAQVFRKVLSFSSAEMDKFSTASLITRTTNDVTQIQAVCVLIVRVVLYAPVIGLGGIIMVARTRTGLGWIIALAVAAMLLLVGVLMKIAMPQFRTMQQRVDDVNLVSREVLTGLPVIRAFHRERHEEERFDTASAALMKTQLFVNRTMAFMGPVMTLIMYGVTVMIEWFGAKSINAGNMQIGDMIAFSTYASLIIMAFMMITIVAVLLPRAEVSATRVDEILRTRASVRDPRSPEPAPADATVTFDHVSFRYPGAEDDVLHDISFTARPGEVTAIVGSTGCGKSTLLNLIPRFYDATGGTVSIGGVNVRRLHQTDLRAMLGYVPQKGVLFTGDILSNLEFGGDVSEADAIRAAATAQAEDFIWSRPHHFLTPVAQGGANVSGGQRQRLSIARAIARHPQVYLLDDSFFRARLSDGCRAASGAGQTDARRHGHHRGAAPEHDPARGSDPRARRRAHRRPRHAQRAAAQLRDLPRDRAQPAQRRGTRRGGLTMAGPRRGPGRIPEKPKNFKGTITKLFRCLGRYRLPLVLVLVLALASTAFGIVGPKILSTATTELATGLGRKLSGLGGIDFGKIGKILLTVLALGAEESCRCLCVNLSNT